MSQNFLTADELALIEKVKNEFTSDPKRATLIWSEDRIKGVKRKIKSKLMENRGATCCYCMANLHGESLDVDVEHVLPKTGDFESEMFIMTNLSISCKRCNMEMKGEDVDFYLDDKTKDYYRSEKYLFIHPNLDEYENHLDYVAISKNRIRIVKYRVVNNSEKGRYTYTYFELDKLEIDQLDKSQGVVSQRISNSELHLKVSELLENL